METNKMREVSLFRSLVEKKQQGADMKEWLLTVKDLALSAVPGGHLIGSAQELLSQFDLDFSIYGWIEQAFLSDETMIENVSELFVADKDGTVVTRSNIIAKLLNENLPGAGLYLLNKGNDAAVADYLEHTGKLLLPYVPSRAIFRLLMSAGLRLNIHQSRDQTTIPRENFSKYNAILSCFIAGQTTKQSVEQLVNAFLDDGLVKVDDTAATDMVPSPLEYLLFYGYAFDQILDYDVVIARLEDSTVPPSAVLLPSLTECLLKVDEKLTAFALETVSEQLLVGRNQGKISSAGLREILSLIGVSSSGVVHDTDLTGNADFKLKIRSDQYLRLERSIVLSVLSILEE